MNSKFKLVYKASKDGFSAKNFHDKCDQVENTLTIIKTTNNFIFGGFTRQNWYGDCVEKLDSSAFIFSLTNKDQRPIKIKCLANQMAIQCLPNYGPVFGAADICIHEAKKGTQFGYINRSNLGEAYIHPIYANKEDRDKAKQFLAGSVYFETEEIEVYQKLES
jgi:hypothetical protein